MYQVTCDVEPLISEGVTCPTGWVISEVNPFDFAQLIELLTFDSATFGTLFGTCVVLFIMGHSAGHVARNLGRV